MQQTYEVIVVGAGPSGCTLAYELAKAGIQVLVIEKQKLPRYKCCAGGLTARAVKALPLEIGDLVEDRVTRIEVQFRDEGHFCGDSDQAFIYTIRRDKFDYALARKAEDAGAVILQGQPVLHVDNTSRFVEITTPENSFRSQFLVGADGARSIVARSAGFTNDAVYITGLNAEISVINKEYARWKGRIFMDIGHIPAGYAWVFPKSDHVSVGIASIGYAAKKLNHYYTEFLDSLGIKEARTIRKSGALIRLGKGKQQLVMKRTALIGDAAGLADPLSGEGIYNAVQSASLAAASIKECLLRGVTDLDGYQHAVDEQLMSEIKIARVLQKIFIHFPKVVINILDFNDNIWKACCRFAQGDLNYTLAKQHVGGFKGMRELLQKVMS